jgi:hypothetical protein
MKIIPVLFAILYSFNINGQYLKLENEWYVFEKIDSVKSLTKQQIYDKARIWVLSNLKSSDSNVELNDTSKSTLISTGNLSIDQMTIFTCAITNGNLNFKMTILIKEGKYKVIVDKMIFSDTRVCYSSTSGTLISNQRFEESPLEKSILPKKKTELLIKETETKLLKLCTDLNQTINGIDSKKSDW